MNALEYCLHRYDGHSSDRGNPAFPDIRLSALLPDNILSEYGYPQVISDRPRWYHPASYESQYDESDGNTYAP